jgi:hypothetical protein
LLKVVMIIEITFAHEKITVCQKKTSATWYEKT